MSKKIKPYRVKFQPYKKTGCIHSGIDGTGETSVKIILGTSKRKAWDREYGIQGFVYPPCPAQFSMKKIQIEKI